MQQDVRTVSKTTCFKFYQTGSPSISNVDSWHFSSTDLTDCSKQGNHPYLNFTGVLKGTQSRSVLLKARSRIRNKS